MRYTFLSSILLVFFSCFSNAYSQNCDALIHYKDVVLVEDFRTAYNKYKLSETAQKDVLKIKEDLLNHRGWLDAYTIGESTTNTILTTALIAQNVKTMCKLIRNGLEVVLIPKGVSLPMNTVQLTAQRVYDILDKGENLYEAVNKNALEVAMKEALKQQGAFGKSITMAWDFAEGVEAMAQMPAEKEKLKTEVQRILGLVEGDLKKYDKSMQVNGDRLLQIIEIREGIKKYLEKHCKDKKELTKPPGKQTTGVEPLSKTPAANQKVPTANSVYIFFTAEVTLRSFPIETVTIISQPVLYNSKEGEMQSEKEVFLKQIENQLFEQLEKTKQFHTDIASVATGNIYRVSTKEEKNKIIERFKESLSANNYEAIKASYNYLGENKKKTLQTKEQCLKEIEKYKSFQIAALEEIGETPKFVQL